MVSLRNEEAQSQILSLRQRGVSNSTGKHSGQYLYSCGTTMAIIDLPNLPCSSHRERKELHMHELELQVIRDKQTHLRTVQEKNAAEEENRLLRQILDKHGIAYPSKNQQPGFVESGPSGSNDESSDNFNFSQSPSTSLSAITSSSMPEPASFRPDLDLETLEIGDGLDYYEIALSFILKLVLLLDEPASQFAVISPTQNGEVFITRTTLIRS